MKNARPSTIFLTPSFILFFMIFGSTGTAQSILDGMAIEVRGESREFSYTNKESAFFYGETNAHNTSSWMGFNVHGDEFIDDYELIVDGVILERESIIRTIVYPDHLVREYPKGITETLRLVDRLPMFAVSVASPKPIDLAIAPYFSDVKSRDEFEIKLKDGTVLLARKAHMNQNRPAESPIWLAFHGTGFVPLERNSFRGSQYSPAILVGSKKKLHTISFAVHTSANESESLVRRYSVQSEQFASARRKRMETLLNQTSVKTSDSSFDNALAWAKISLDALIMNFNGKGIFAGLPWFNSYWGRDTFISLPGAVLVTGHFNEAKKILLSFAEFQKRDETSTDYGRIPNIVTTSTIGYNTADGTPRFVMMAKDYVLRSGDSSFILQIYPVVMRSIEGTLRYHTDSLGYLTHGDAETWMDAVGPDGPWSPRGNRANDIQALWAEQLEAGIWFASTLGDVTSAQRWNKILQKLKINFRRDFITANGIADHLNLDGVKDIQVRPNQIFTTVLLKEEDRRVVLHQVVNNLTYEYGVASLSQQEENFHPYHQYPAFYPKDAAYHNGVVWTWLQGKVISELLHFNETEIATKITYNAVEHILKRGAVGTMTEILDAIPRPGTSEPRLSGTFSQAWSLAEFIRNFYDDYLGIYVSRYNHDLMLRPRLPKNLTSVNATINLNGRSLPIAIKNSDLTQSIRIDGSELKNGGTAKVDLTTSMGSQMIATFNIPPKSILDLELNNTTLTLSNNGSYHHFDIREHTHTARNESKSDLTILKPVLLPGLKSLTPPSYPLMSHREIKSEPRRGRLFVQQSDPVGDDVGTGAYTYPSHPMFKPGCLDLKNFSVIVDDSNMYFSLGFKSLSNPGWHPEYGFQLTYVAIAVDEDGVAGSGRMDIPQNANYFLESDFAYEKLMLVGGGIRIEDKDRRILAAYIPAESDVSNPLGDTQSATISFAIPIRYIGKPTPEWKFVVLVGAQDDHGGSGLGEFRSIEEKRGEWHGGGKVLPIQSNIYDTLVVRPTSR